MQINLYQANNICIYSSISTTIGRQALRGKEGRRSALFPEHFQTLTRKTGIRGGGSHALSLPFFDREETTPRRTALLKGGIATPEENPSKCFGGQKLTKRECVATLIREVIQSDMLERCHKWARPVPYSFLSLIWNVRNPKRGCISPLYPGHILDTILKGQL